MSPCRCGHMPNGGDHPCHGGGYTCRRPAKQRFYVPNPNASLAGMQVKFSMSETWTCDTCWVRFSHGFKKETTNGTT